MRLAIDTNVLISALLFRISLPASLLLLWRNKRFDLLTSLPQLDELTRVTRYPKIRDRLAPASAGRLINQLHDHAIVVSDLPAVAASPDPDNDYLLATAFAGRADFLITGTSTTCSHCAPFRERALLRSGNS